MITENLKDFKINKLTQEQYDRALAAGEINENELYMTESSEGGGSYLPLSGGTIDGNLKVNGDVMITPTEESVGQVNLVGVIDDSNVDSLAVISPTPTVTIGYRSILEEDGVILSNGAQIRYSEDIYDANDNIGFPASLNLLIVGSCTNDYNGTGSLSFNTVHFDPNDESGNNANIRINGVANPLEDYDAVNKKYVDDLMKVDTATEV